MTQKLKIDLPKNVNRIIEMLEKRGFEGFAVGGCVRDSLLKRTPVDWDITTNALPQEMKQIFTKTFDTGIAHGTVTVLMGGETYELTTYRVDGDYSDGRHPDSVSFSKNLKEDLCRRDFTINAMAYSHARGIIDLYDGIGDLKKGVIRAVGDARERFSEDALRMLRAVRFSAQLGFEIEEGTFDAVKERAGLLINVSKERIFAELNRTLMGSFSQKLRLVYESGLSKYIGRSFADIPESFYYVYPGDFGGKRYMYWAVFLRNIENTEDAKRILTELKSDNVTVGNMALLINELKFAVPESDEDIRWSLCRLGYELFEDYLKILESDAKAGGGDRIQDAIEAVKKRYLTIKQERQAVNIAMLDISGTDLIAMGIPKGPKIGEVLHLLLREVIRNPRLNTRAVLSERVRDILGNK